MAKAAGFERPILHGMCTMGYAGHAVMAAVCGYDGARVRSMQVRFTAPAWPGETLRTEMWIDGDIVGFRTRALERDTLVLGNGANGARPGVVGFAPGRLPGVASAPLRRRWSRVARAVSATVDGIGPAFRSIAVSCKLEMNF